MRISFIWQGFDGRYGKWQDGLWAAMKLIEREHEVRYFDFPLKGMEEFNPDVVLYWEAPVSCRGKNADNWFSVCNLPYPKALLFAGGELKAMDVKDFDIVFVESAINEDDCERQGIPYIRAFGVNTQIFKPEPQPKVFDAMLHATFAGWKRHELFALSVGNKGLVVGRIQEYDRNGYNACREKGTMILDEVAPSTINSLLNASWCVLNTSEYWGGGQRCTLEAMSTGIPVIVMSDSPKNREYVEESGAGIICDPDPESIIGALCDIKLKPGLGQKGIEYIQSKWTEKHYKDNLIKGIKCIIPQTE